MRKFLKKFIEILDGTPSVYGERQKGQSVLEMAFITPLLIVLIVGIVEIGWLANNYLVLQEVTKVGARRATVLPGDIGPLGWELDDALHDAVLLPSQWTENQSIEPGWSAIMGSGDTAAIAAYGDRDWDRILIRLECNDASLRGDTNGTGNLRRSFYNELLCVMFDSLDPLVLDRENGTDDIIISVFSVQTIFNDPAGDFDFENAPAPAVDVDEYAQGYIPVVVGRYPTNANECNILADATPASLTDNIEQDIERDPFDYINDNTLTFSPVDSSVPLEIASLSSSGWTMVGYDDSPEFQRGFSLYGNHMVDPIEVTDSSGNTSTYNVLCYGSNWSVQDVQEQMGVPEFQFTAEEAADPRIVNDDTGEFLPSQGLVLVEMYWEHQLLLNLPVFSPVMQALGDDRATIYVWSVFPVPTVEPTIVFP